MNITSYTSSFISQNSLASSSKSMNTALERLTTGCKINHSSDNAANYSISQSMSSKLSSYKVAEENAMMGLDMVQTANSTLDSLQEYATRLKYLAEQAQNGTYSAESLQAINAEAESIMTEMNAIQARTEYNGIQILGTNVSTYIADLMKSKGVGCGVSGIDLYAPSGASGAEEPSNVGGPSAGDPSGAGGSSGASGAGGAGGASGASGVSSMVVSYSSNGIDYNNSTSHYGRVDWASGLIVESADLDTVGIQEGAVVGLSSDINLTPLHNGFISEIETVTPDIIVSNVSQLADAIQNNNIIGISNAGVLVKLAELVNSGTTCSGKTIVLTENIDLTEYCAEHEAEGGWTAIGTTENKFNGTFDGQGHTISNLTISAPDSDYQGLFGFTGEDSVIKNVGLENGHVYGQYCTGSLVGLCYGDVSNCYATGQVRGHREKTGGLIGASIGETRNCYATANVTGYGGGTGGLIGTSNGETINCYATGYVKGNELTGGLLGGGSAINCYATGNVEGDSETGGLIGNGTATNSYATGVVTGNHFGYTGGLIGYGAAYNSYAIGNVMSVNNEQNVGGLVGSGLCKNSYATGSVSGGFYVGGLIGNGSSMNCYATGDVTGNGQVGGLAGCDGCGSGTIYNSYATGSVTGTQDVGGLIGSGSATSCYATGNVTGTNENTGGLIGSGTATNCYALGNVTGQGGRYTGGLIGKGNATNCYAIGNVVGLTYAGGLIGIGHAANCYATGNVTGISGYTGGLIGYSYGATSNCYATGAVTGNGNCTGGLIGFSEGTTSNCYAIGNVSGNDSVGGLVGCAYSLQNCYSTGNVIGREEVGGIAGNVHAISNCYAFNKVTGQNSYGAVLGSCDAHFTGGYCSTINPGLTVCANSGPSWKNSDYEDIKLPSGGFTGNLQIGIGGNSSAQIGVEIKLPETTLDSIVSGGLHKSGTLEAIDAYIAELSQQQVKLGAVQNRIKSAIESISVAYDNLVSSRSTLTDVDISKVSSQFIRQQILQQASATLLSTANQNSDLTLQLINRLQR